MVPMVSLVCSVRVGESVDDIILNATGVCIDTGQFLLKIGIRNLLHQFQRR
jgi:hypothetical protein